MKKCLMILLAIFIATGGFVLVSCGEIDAIEGASFSSRAAESFTSNKTGTKNGWDYEYWKDSGSGTMTVNDNGTFKGSWSNIGNLLMRTGKKFNSSQTHNQIGNISITYDASFTPGGNSYLCVYGWSKDPLVEYYIVESYGTYDPRSASDATKKKSWNGYDLFETTRTNQPSIEGTKTFKQYWAVRQSKRTSGTIDVTGVFNAWYNNNMSLGKMYEVSLCLEGWQSSGSGEIKSYTLKYGSTTLGGGSSSTTPPASTPPASSTPSTGTKVECESMTKGGQYTGGCSSPFNGVTLYANNDKVSYSQYFSNNKHAFTLRGASTNSSQASVELKIGGTSYGTFKFSGTNASDQTITAAHNKGGGNAAIELICVNDNNTWDVKLDYLEIKAAN